MTDKIGIDEQIAHQQECADAAVRIFTPSECAIHSAKLATLRDYKRIQEAKVPEPVAWRWKNTNGPWTLEHRRDLIIERFAKVIQPLYGPEVLDLLRRETAKNERIKELLREPSEGMLKVGAKMYGDCLYSSAGFEHHAAHVLNAMSAALLADVEKEVNDGK